MNDTKKPFYLSFESDYLARIGASLIFIMTFWYNVTLDTIETWYPLNNIARREKNVIRVVWAHTLEFFAVNRTEVYL